MRFVLSAAPYEGSKLLARLSEKNENTRVPLEKVLWLCRVEKRWRRAAGGKEGTRER